MEAISFPLVKQCLRNDDFWSNHYQHLILYWFETESSYVAHAGMGLACPLLLQPAKWCNYKQLLLYLASAGQFLYGMPLSSTLSKTISLTKKEIKKWPRYDIYVKWKKHTHIIYPLPSLNRGK